MFTKSCEYGIRAIIYIAQQSQAGMRVSLKHVAEAIDSPVAFTAKILQSLAKNQLISSTKGATGGYQISADQLNKMTLLDVVNAIDGNQIYNRCGLGLKACNANKPCPMHHQFKKIRDELKIMLETTSINELVNNLTIGEAFLRR